MRLRACCSSLPWGSFCLNNSVPVRATLLATNIGSLIFPLQIILIFAKKRVKYANCHISTTLPTMGATLSRRRRERSGGHWTAEPKRGMRARTWDSWTRGRCGGHKCEIPVSCQGCLFCLNCLCVAPSGSWSTSTHNISFGYHHTFASHPALFLSFGEKRGWLDDRNRYLLSMNC